MKNIKKKRNQLREKDKRKLYKEKQKTTKTHKIGKEEMVELQNIDFEKADEALLKAEKKKFDEAFKKVDREDVLFAEVEFSDQEGEVKDVLPGRKVKGKNLTNPLHAENITENKTFNEKAHLTKEKKPANKKENAKRPRKLVLHEKLTQEKKFKLCSSIENKDDLIKLGENSNKHKEKETQTLIGNFNLIQQNKSETEPVLDSKVKDDKNRKLNINDIYPTTEREAIGKKKKSTKKDKNRSTDAETNANTNVETSNEPDANDLKKSTKIENKHLDSHRKLILEKMIKKKNRRRPLIVDGAGLRQRMLERVKAAQFRLINETLYTSSGTEAQQLFQKKPEAFEAYHEGFRQQVKKWPINPLTEIIKRICTLPKSYIIADMGCGDATLAKSVPQKVHSFDLVASSPEVVSCDIAKTPLKKESVDVAVFCLALMGTELQKYLAEANRILKLKGKLLIAEVESRFEDVNGFLESVRKLGFKLLKVDQRHKVFLFLEFSKVADSPHRKPQISLKPCLYKKR